MVTTPLDLGGTSSLVLESRTRVYAGTTRQLGILCMGSGIQGGVEDCPLFQAASTEAYLAVTDFRIVLNSLDVESVDFGLT